MTLPKREDEATLMNAEKNIVAAEGGALKVLDSDVPRKKKQFKVDIRQARQALREIEADVAALPFLIEKELKTINDLENAKIQLENRRNTLRNRKRTTAYTSKTLFRDSLQISARPWKTPYATSSAPRTTSHRVGPASVVHSQARKGVGKHKEATRYLQATAR
ncbi:MAG: hypothetical protein U5N86_12500 [Planctomycetota bacterium]|nr:hypothetical protein [Planctomycetota bacterium]